MWKKAVKTMQNHVMLMRKFKHFSKTLKFHESIIITVLSLVITRNQKLSYERLCLKVPCGYCERKLRGQTVVNCCSFCDSSALCCVRKKSIRREGIWEKKKPDWGEHDRSCVCSLACCVNQLKKLRKKAN